ncbi:MAG: GlmU family protein [Flavobacteriales bacterium]
MNVILFEDSFAEKFLPLTFTRPVGALRIGMLTIAEKWSHALQFEVSHECRSYLSIQFPAKRLAQSILINARLLPTTGVVSAIQALQPDQCLMQDDVLIAGYTANAAQIDNKQFTSQQKISDTFMLNHITDLFTKNDEALKLDYDVMKRGHISESLDSSIVTIGDTSKIFMAEGAKVYACTLNTHDGPIYIDKNAEVMEGAHIRGPFYLGQHSHLKMGAKVYGPTTIGPHCKVGGEVSNSILQGYSNKAHDGFIGNTLIGEWCNLGADTNTSNLKNNYSSVKIFDYGRNDMTDTGLTFCGLIMGDHSKCGINTMFNTGTVCGVGSNIFGGDFPPKHIPSFVWGGSDGFSEYDFEKMIATARQVYTRRGLVLSDNEERIMRNVFEMTAKHRTAATQSQD